MKIALAVLLVVSGLTVVVAAVWPLLVTAGIGWGAFRFMAHRAGWRRERRGHGVLRELVVLELGALLGLGVARRYRRP